MFIFVHHFCVHVGTLKLQLRSQYGRTVTRFYIEKTTIQKMDHNYGGLESRHTVSWHNVTRTSYKNKTFFVTLSL